MFAYQVEVQVISAFRELVVKLNDSTFCPVFRRLYDWAFVHEAGMSVPEIWFVDSQLVLADDPRKIIFFHTYCGLLDFFKVCPLSPCWFEFIRVITVSFMIGPHGSIYIIPTSGLWCIPQDTGSIFRRILYSLDFSRYYPRQNIELRWWRYIH